MPRVVSILLASISTWFRSRLAQLLPANDVRALNMGIEEVKIAPRSPWQNPYCERVVGSMRRDALDHVIVFSERHLRRVLRSYVDDYHDWRMHLSLEMDAPESRAEVV